MRPRRCALAALVVLALSAGMFPAAAQWIYPIAEPEPSFEDIPSPIFAEPLELRGGWMEITPLTSEDPPVVLRIAPRMPEDGELLVEPELPPGPVMLCSGGEGYAVACDTVFYDRGGSFWRGEPTVPVEARFEGGVEVTGRYLLDRWPVVGAKVAVVPADLEVQRPFTLPLVGSEPGESDASPGAGDPAHDDPSTKRRPIPSELPREVLTDEEGAFRLPALAGGEYFLETLLPSGRVHRSESFVLPTLPPELPRRSDSQDGTSRAESARREALDLGVIDIDDGLAVELRVQDVEGLPIAGAKVAGRQGRSALDLVSFESRTGTDGVARLSGFTVEKPVHLSCRAPGYTGFEQDYELVPVVVTCVLEPLAALLGDVVSPVGEPVPGAVLTLSALETLTGADPPEPRVDLIGVDGGFLFAELEPGVYDLTVAAPGYEILEIPLTLAPGEQRELETLVLLAGAELDGVVVDAGSGEPVAGAEIFGVEPLGSAWALSDAAGEFTVVSASDRALVLEVSAPGYAVAEVTVTPERFASGEPVRVELAEAGWIRVVVWDEATDQPCQGCTVVIWPSGQRLRTDRLGEALSGPLEPAYYSVYRPRIIHLGSAVVEQDDAEFRYARVEPGEITTVRFGDQTDIVRVRFEPGSEPGWRISARTRWRTENVLRAPDGSFHVRRRPGEEMELFLHFYDPESDAEVEVWQATLPARHEGELVLPRHGAELHGRARSAFESLAGIPVRLRSLASIILATVYTRTDGRFVIPHMPPGTYFLAIGGSNVKFVQIYEGRDVDLGTFDLIPGSF